MPKSSIIHHFPAAIKPAINEAPILEIIRAFTHFTQLSLEHKPSFFMTRWMFEFEPDCPENEEADGGYVIIFLHGSDEDLLAAYKIIRTEIGTEMKWLSNPKCWAKNAGKKM